MWRPISVVGLWVALVAAPHLGAPTVTASLAGVVPSGDELEDPPLQGASTPARAREQPGAFATVRFENDLGKTLTLTSATVTMDGKPLPVITELGPGNETVVFAGRVAPGPHAVETHLTCRGRQRGPFTYMKDIAWDVRSNETLVVPPERAVVFTIAAIRRAGPSVPFTKQVEIAVRSQLVPPKVSAR